MSLAMFAASFNEPFTNDNDNNAIINKKRRSHNRTQKASHTEGFDTNKVNSILDKIHNNSDDTDDEQDTFNPPPKAISAGVQKTKPLPQKEQMTNMLPANDFTFKAMGQIGRAHV